MADASYDNISTEYMPDLSLICNALKIVYEKVEVDKLRQALREKDVKIANLERNIESLKAKLDVCNDKLSNIEDDGDTAFCETCNKYLNIGAASNWDADIAFWCDDCYDSFCGNCADRCLECRNCYCNECFEKSDYLAKWGPFHMTPIPSSDESNETLCYCGKCYDVAKVNHILDHFAKN